MDQYIIPKLKNLAEELHRCINTDVFELESLRMIRQDNKAFANPEYDDSDWQMFHAGEEWGGWDEVIWLRADWKTPVSMCGKTLDLKVEMSARDGCETLAESLLYLDGKETHGFDNWHDTVRLTDEQSCGEHHIAALRCWSGLWKPKRRFLGASIRAVNVPTEHLYFLTKILTETAELLDKEDCRRIRLLQLTDEAFRAVDFRVPRSPAFYASVETALRMLREKVEALRLDGEDKPVVDVCGHTHIDMAWLWRYCHTREKAARSFSTVLTLMKQYPQYRFSQSSPLVYEMIRKHYPDLFEQIRNRIAEGRWEITGGMWVEADTNLPSGESLVRQILLGKGYMRRMFGVECQVLWLPDVFGYSAVLPQLLKKSGFRMFWTNKLCWNQYDRFPYDTFYWKGLDGSVILTHLGTCPEKDVTWGGTYNGIIAPWEIKGTWDAYQQKDLNNEVLMPFGYGDGGGGPSREMLEAYDVMRSLPGLPRVEMCTCEEFAQNLERNVQEKNVPVWDGELYFEYHRGTYTSQAAVKRNNRRSECLYHDVEFLNAVRDIILNQNVYPAEEIRENWKHICTNQFHDVIPGSGIREIYEDAQELYDAVLTSGKRMCDEAERCIAEQIRSQESGIVVFNTLPWERDAIVFLGAEYADTQFLRDGAVLQTQRCGDGIAVRVKDLPTMGYCRLTMTSGHFAKSKPIPFNGTLENEFYRIRLNEAGQFISLYDKEAEREVLEIGGIGNELRVYEDKPHQFSAWNTEIYAYEKSWAVTDRISACLRESGSLRTVLEQTYRYGRSEIRQRIILTDDRCIRFETECDWNEEDALLKVCFPVNIRATKATYDIQFGNLERPTHSNTSWDYAQFEVCAHKWADISEGNYGVAILNDCKYGCDIKESLIRLTLIKTSHYPDAHADCGHHTFTYMLMPHTGSWKEAGVARAGYELNVPVIVCTAPAAPAGVLPECFSFVRCDRENVVVETVKQAEDGDGWIIRVYEYMQCRGKAALIFSEELERAEECNLMEETERMLSVAVDRITFDMAPYEIKTFRIHFRKP